MQEELYRRELRWTELFSYAFHVFAENAGAILKVMVIIFLPISLLEGVLLDRIASNQAILQTIQQSDALLSDASVVTTALLQMLSNELIYLAVMLFLQPVGIIAVARLTKQRLEGREISAKAAILEAIQMEPTILVSGIIWGVLVMFGSLVIIPGIYYAVAWCLYLFAIGLSDKKGWEALRYSKTLVRGRWWRTAGVLLLFGCVSMLFNSAFELVYVFGTENAGIDTLYHFLCYFSTSFVAAGEAILFLNREAVCCGKRFDPNVIDAEAEEKEDK